VVFSEGTNRQIVKFLGPHGPDALLAFIFFSGAVGLITAGYDIVTVSVFAVVLYAIYAVRQTQGERHRERAAQLAVETKENDLRIYRERQAAKIRKDTVKAIPAPKGRATTGSKKS